MLQKTSSSTGVESNQADVTGAGLEDDDDEEEEEKAVERAVRL